MQYILTEEEYKNLVPKSKYEEKCDEIKELQLLLMTATGHTCIYYNTQGDDDDDDEIYCDKCPLAYFDCGKRKEFSQ